MERRVLLLAIALVVVAGCFGPSAERTVPGVGVAESLRLAQPRAVHRATRLADGSVLLTGGCTESGCGGFDAGTRSELYNPDRGFVRGPSMSTPRASGTATLLEDGRVLLTGGYPGEGLGPTAAAEIYHPDSNEFMQVSDLRVARADHTASLLPNGQVVIAGGFNGSGAALASTEVFDPTSDQFTTGPDLSAPRAAHVATVVSTAVVLVGGTQSSEATRSTDVLRAGAWELGPRLTTPRVKLAVAPLPAGRVLVIGGATDVEGHQRLATTEIIDMGRRVARRGPELRRGAYKLDGAVAVLGDGRVVIPSGNGLEVFDPVTEELSRLAIRTNDAHSFRTMTPVHDNQVLLAGGYDDSITPTDEAVVARIPPA